MRKPFSALMLSAMLTLSLGSHAQPMLRIFELGVQPGKQAQFDEAARANLLASVAGEPGTLAMHAASPQGDANLAYLFEIYADEAAYQAHTEGAPYKGYLQKAPQLLGAHRKFIATEAQFLAEKPQPIHPDMHPDMPPDSGTPVMSFAQVLTQPNENAAFAQKVLPALQQAMQASPQLLALYAGTAKDNPNQWFFIELHAQPPAQPHAYLHAAQPLLQSQKISPMQGRVLVSKGGLTFSRPAQGR